MGRPSRVALVVQRYGPEVNGGAEQLARRVARLLAGELDLTVLTTCALDYRTWANHYPAGRAGRGGRARAALPGGARARRRGLRRPLRARLRRARRRRARRGAGWTAQGPDAPGADRAPARRGRRLRRGRLRHLPLPHDGRRASASWPTARCWCRRCTTSRRPGWRSSAPVFDAARALDLLRPRRSASWRASASASATTAPASPGWGLDPPPPSDPARMARARRRAALRALRRADRPLEGRRRARRAPRALPAGRARTGSTWCSSGGGDAPPARPPVAAPAGLRRGAVKHDALAGAAVVVVPSPYESLSLVQLEAWGHGRPTLANAASPVLVGQSRRSGGGLWYRDGDEYAAMLDLLARAAARSRARSAARGGAGRPTTCSWDRVRAVWLDALALAAGPRGRRAAAADGAVLSIYGLGLVLCLSPASRSPGCSTSAGAGSASRRSRSGSASWSPCSTRSAR